MDKIKYEKFYGINARKELTPEITFNQYKLGLMDEGTAREALILTIENHSSESVRINALKCLQHIGRNDDWKYEIFENLMVSDAYDKMRFFATKFLIDNYLNKVSNALKTVLINEMYPKSVKLIIETIEKESKEVVHKFLIDNFRKILSMRNGGKYDWHTVQYRFLFEQEAIEHFSYEELLNMYYNYVGISCLLRKYNINIVFEIDRGIIKKLFINSVPIKRISELDGLELLTGLKYLSLQLNEIEEIDGLDTLRNLENLFLDHNKISRITGLDNLINLISLSLDYNQIERIENLCKLRNLRDLNLRDNRIEMVEGLQNLKELEALYLDSNKIIDISGLIGLTNLRKLYLNKNEVESIMILNFLPNLEELGLENRNIKLIKNIN